MGGPLHEQPGREAGERRIVVASDGRADAVVTEALPELSRARVQRLINEGRIRVGGRAIRKSTLLAAGDTLTVDLPEPGPPLGPVPHADLPILFEDDDLLATDKPPGVSTHVSPGDDSPTVAAWFAARYPDLARAFDDLRPGVVHRLDRDTSGVLLLAKTPASRDLLYAAFEGRRVEKAYLAVCEGVPRQERAVIDAPVGRAPSDRSRMAVVRDGTGREARTTYEILGSGRDRSLLLVHPETGRTHQVRVHLAAIGHPITFDPTYGTPGPGRHLLHAWRLEVPHPAGGSLQVTAPMPADMAAEVRAIGVDGLASRYSMPAAPVRQMESPTS